MSFKLVIVVRLGFVRTASIRGADSVPTCFVLDTVGTIRVARTSADR